MALGVFENLDRIISTFLPFAIKFFDFKYLLLIYSTYLDLLDRVEMIYKSNDMDMSLQ